jgi:DUF1365 family protein
MRVLSTTGYLGTVMHQRLRPRRHRLRYGVYFWLFDLAELAAGLKPLRLFSRNRFNLFSFYDRDHGAGNDEPVDCYVRRELAAAGIELNGGAVKLLCCPRLLGYAFNPLSVYFCHHADGALAAILYEVNNTFGQRHSYLIRVDEPAAEIRQSCRKEFYVSPFMEMGLTYHFTVAPPGETVAIKIREDDPEGALLFASFVGTRAPLSDPMLLRLFFTYPLVTLKIVMGIHWEALRLWLKGVRLVTRPAPPAHAITIVADHVR